MSIAVATLPTPKRRFGIDWSQPIFVGLVMVLGVLVVLPLFWLAYYSVLGTKGDLTLANFAALVYRPDAAAAVSHRHRHGARRRPPVLRHRHAARLARGPHRPAGRRLVRVLRDGLVRDAAVPRRHRLGDPGGAEQRHLQRRSTAASSASSAYDYLVDIYTFTGLVFAIACYTFPYVFTLVANALDRVPTDLEEASAMLGGGMRTTLRKVTIPLVLPAMLAGTLIAILQSLTMFGSPAILALPAGFHVITTKIWSLFQYPPKPGLAAAAALPLLIITVLLLWGQARILGRRGYTVLGGKSGDAAHPPPRPMELARLDLSSASCSA